MADEIKELKIESKGSAKSLAAEQLGRYQELKTERDSLFKPTWQFISQYFLPQDSNINVEKTPGQTASWTDRIFDTTPIQCAETLKSGQYNWLTPPNQPWAEFGVPQELKGDAQGEEDDDATLWLGRCSDIAMKELAMSNFYSVAAESYLGVGVFGTDLMLCEEGKRTTLNFRHARIGTYVIEEDDEGIVDTVRREWEMTYRQACQFFKKTGDKLPDKMVKDAEGEAGKVRKFKFLHCIFPREDSDRLPGRKDGPNKPIASVYIAMDYKECVRIAGYDEQPILCPRFDKWGTGSAWGYGPGYLGLPDARQLNYVQQYMDSLAELHADPRVLVPDSLEGDVDLRAGGITTWDSSNPNGKPETWGDAGEYKLGMELQEQKREALRTMFYVQAFQLLNSQPLIDRKEMTAYEISQRQAEQLSSFTPAFARRVSEFLNPLMLRVFGILYRAGKFGQPPQSLMKPVAPGKYGLVMPQVVITSRISDALKALKNRGTEETFRFLEPMLETQPEIMDNFDTDKLAKDYAENTGMPADGLRSVKNVAKIRQARAQVQAQQRQVALAQQMAAAGKDLGSAPQWMQSGAQQALGAA
jgi:hypothetical protein